MSFQSNDVYLAEKLKEILVRLYPNQTHSSTSSSATTRLPPPKSSHSNLNGSWTSSHNVDLPGRNSSASDFQDNFRSDQVLTQSLTDFIKFLKISMKSDETQIKSNEPLDDTMGLSRSTSASFYPIITGTDIDMDFNMSEADIADLNGLLTDQDKTLVDFRHVLIICVYFVISFVAIIGNLLVVQLVIKSRRLHISLTHVLLANLALADLIIATVNIPFSAARVILKEWPFGSFLCRSVPFIQVASVYAISYTMTVIALDRYQVIMNPLRRRLKIREGIPVVIGIWLLSTVLSVPYALHHQVVSVLTLGVVKRCRAEFQSPRSRQWLTVCTFLLQYLIPLTVTTLSYVSIMRRLGSRSTALGSTTARQAKAQSRAKMKTIKMLILTVVFFAVSWAPINTYHLLTHFGILRHNSHLILISHLVAMSSSCYNPYIYCWLNEHFRQEATRWSRCFRTRRCPFVHPGIEVNGMLQRTDLLVQRNQSSNLVLPATSIKTPFFSGTTSQYSADNSGRRTRRRPELIFLTTSSFIDSVSTTSTLHHLPGGLLESGRIAKKAIVTPAVAISPMHCKKNDIHMEPLSSSFEIDRSSGDCKELVEFFQCIADDYIGEDAV